MQLHNCFEIDPSCSTPIIQNHAVDASAKIAILA